MTKLLYLFTLVFVCNSFFVTAQTIDSLRKNIQRIVSSKNATVGVGITDSKGRDALFINGDGHCPTQSVFKFHIALVLMSEIDKGKFSLDQKIRITPKDLAIDMYSPIKDKYPQGTELTIAEIIQYTVSESDGIGCDVLLRLLGGPSVVEKYFQKKGFKNISIKVNEEVMQSKWENQFRNWTTPKSANQLLTDFYENKKQYLSAKSHEFIWKVMKATVTGENRLRGQLPKETVIAHKTGTSGVNKQTGIRGAVNDIGIVFLPNGEYFAISVFVTNSKENIDTNEKIIADIAKAAWDYYTSKKS